MPTPLLVVVAGLGEIPLSIKAGYRTGRLRDPRRRPQQVGAMTWLLFAMPLMSCDDSRQPMNAMHSANNESVAAPAVETEVSSTPFLLYSTLAGKMARMEELLNGIDRFLDDPDFQERVVSDSQEFHRLLTETRGVYPERLAAEDQLKFDAFIDDTAATSTQLIRDLQQGHREAARETLIRLDRQRQEAHTRFSY
ncbi:MAG: hypothetical protein AAGD07_06925 [Planctomycetota bacterium]